MTERMNDPLVREDLLERAFAAHNQKLREVIEEHKTWLEAELRKAHEKVARLMREQDLLIKENLRLRDVVARMREALGPARI